MNGNTIRILVGILVVTTYCQGQDRDFWMNKARESIREAVVKKPIEGVAKNVILFLGDGMGVSTVTAARILKGQLEGGTGEEYRLKMETLPYVGFAKTYNTDKQTPDSAGTATALLTGVKTRSGTLGVDQRVVKGNCSNVHQASLDTLKDWALAAGKSIGIVTTARITHATPGSVYAKTCHRDYEVNTPPDKVTDFAKVKDIAAQLVDDNHDIQVLMGGGRSFFTPAKGEVTEEAQRTDGQDLVKKWWAIQEAKGVRFAYVNNNDELRKVDASKLDHLFGLFNPSHMTWDAHRQETGPSSEPSITDMLVKALQVLQKNDKGFFLMVEGGRIDHGHHENRAHEALTETIAFDQAITKALQLTSETDTLVMVTADHSHVFAIAGYPDRGQDIVGTFYDASKSAPSDGLPMTVLQYTNGPGPQRTDLRNADTTDQDFAFPNGLPMPAETHGGEDVPVFAQGPMAHLVGAVHEQNVLAHIMAYSACIGPHATRCQDDGLQNGVDGAENKNVGNRLVDNVAKSEQGTKSNHGNSDDDDNDDDDDGGDVNSRSSHDATTQSDQNGSGSGRFTGSFMVTMATLMAFFLSRDIII